MIHYIQWEIRKIEWKTFIINESFWLEIHYGWNNSIGALFLHPHLDDTNKTCSYYAFDTLQQKIFYEKITKISGIWPKTWHAIAILPLSEIQKAIWDNDIWYLRKVPWVWPKTAKRLIVELQTASKNIWEFHDWRKDRHNAISATLSQFGYDKSRIRTALDSYTWDLIHDPLQTIIQYVIREISKK